MRDSATAHPNRDAGGVPPFYKTLKTPKEFAMQTDPNLVYLFAACSAVWIILFAYIIHLKNRSAFLAEQLRNLPSPPGGKSAES